MELRLYGRTALITGGSRGLGRAMAETFAAAGASVAVVARDQATIDETVAALRDANPDGAHVGVSADMSDATAVEQAYDAAVAGCGQIDVLVNNAGTRMAKPFLDVSDDDWLHDFDLKFFAAVRLSRLCLPHMRDQGWGRILNTLNSAAKAPGANSCPTSVARAAGMALTKSMASEFAADGVLVNALNTGLLVTHQWETQYEGQDRFDDFDEFVAATGKRIPAGRMGDAQEFANLALFLASDAASYVTGTAINIDGGLSPVV